MNDTPFDEIDAGFDAFAAQARLFEIQKAGDVILVRNGPGRINRLYQWLFRSLLRFRRGPIWQTIPSHVLIVVCPGLYLESMPKTGVRLTNAEECCPGTFSFFRVLRHPNAEKFSQEALAEALEWHFGQSYNYKINMTWWRRKFHSHSYCSQLVASIYERTGQSLPGKAPHLTLPIDIASLEYDAGWHDVTADYLEADRLLEQGHGQSIMFSTGRLVTRMKMQQSYEMADAQQLFHQLNETTALLRRRVKTNRLLARVSSRIASIYGRTFISATVPTDRPLSSRHCAKILLGQIESLLDNKDIFANANSWRLSDQKFQKKYARGKAESEIALCGQALAYVLASFVFSQVIINGTQEHFEKYRCQLFRVTYLPKRLVQHARQAVTQALPALAPLLKEKNRLATMWTAAMLGLLKMCVLAHQLHLKHDLTVIRQSSAVSDLGKDWLAYFSSLPVDDRDDIRALQKAFTAQMIATS